MSAKVGKPVSEVPSGGPRGGGKYEPIYKQVDNLPNGDWLPVSFPTKREAYNFYLTAKTHRTRLLDVTSRQRTIYIRKHVADSIEEK